MNYFEVVEMVFRMEWEVLKLRSFYIYNHDFSSPSHRHHHLSLSSPLIATITTHNFSLSSPPSLLPLTAKPPTLPRHREITENESRGESEDERVLCLRARSVGGGDGGDSGWWGVRGGGDDGDEGGRRDDGDGEGDPEGSKRKNKRRRKGKVRRDDCDGEGDQEGSKRKNYRGDGEGDPEGSKRKNKRRRKGKVRRDSSSLLAEAIETREREGERERGDERDFVT
ncbi:hypothetical protein Syun_008661 [Stephania yunnanensis]|uniref:Uncharacterized protein n=1 Tax=Stephania yunnanensis TaxID=152371 RepID=A0AAP0PNC6_9MAGN